MLTELSSVILRGGVTGETWLLNDSFQRITKLFYCFDSTYEPDTAIIAFTVDFSSNGQQFTKLVGSRMGPNPSIDTTKAVQVMGIWADAWKDEAYRTITLSEPASGDFLTWLQSNTIKQ